MLYAKGKREMAIFYKLSIGYMPKFMHSVEEHPYI